MDISAMFLLLLGVLCLGPAPSWARQQFHDSTNQDPQRGPHLTGCHSPEQETFTCWWTPGSWQNMSEPGDLRFFYTVQLPTEKPPRPREWHECPQYSASRPNECHFSRNYTHVWVPYCVELRSVERNVTYDWKCFSVENIVKPDPPINLNWTLQNISRSGLLFDIMVRWEPPPTAAIAMGWISLTYQVQYRLVNSSHWDVIDQDTYTYQPIYSLQTDKTYEVRVRCRMRTYEFGEFTDTIIVRVADILSKDATFPMTVLMVFGVVGMVILLMLIIFTQQQRLMVILLPPVPAPKIKGIDNELLKKGKLDDLNLILSSQHMMYKPDMFPDESWVEFIELDVDDPEHDPGDKADTSDTQHLLGGGDVVGGRHGGHRQGCLGSSHALSLKDDDSGRASCYDPELPMEALLTAALLPQAEQAKLGRVGAREGGGGGDDDPVSHTDSANSTNPSPGGGTPTSGIGTPEHPGGQPQQQGQPQIVTGGTGGVSGPNWATMDFYAQVSDVTPAGGVVLSPGALLASQTSSSSSSSSVPDKNKKNSEKDQEMNEEEDKRRVKEKEKKEVEGGMTPKFHLLVVNPDGGYASESVAKDPVIEPPQQVAPGGYTTSPVPILSLQDEHPPGVDPASCLASSTTTTPTTTPGDYQSPYCLPDAMPTFITTPTPSSMPPVSDYTVVQDVDAQHSLLLNAASPIPLPPSHQQQSPPPNSGKHLPAMPAMPMGYLTPELMGNLMP
ncbi:growth hormone receptor a [Engraulis encrasicolus]|uniref:growth hormone receptor a n=1 Tax=Engraulis encrasicolus TaxID=184585 RepID=UPI002FD14C3C